MKFIPTYLYIKQHSITGMSYLGKTIKNPITYKGSGKYWIRHINKHDRKYIVTKWTCLFNNKDDLEEFALFISEELDIVNSDKWANLKAENGLDGGATMNGRPGTMLGRHHTECTRELLRISSTGRNHSDVTKLKMRISSLGKLKSESHKVNLKGPKQILICPHCRKRGGGGIMKRWHFDNCKLRSL
jgi:hypothetical protein